MFLNEITTPLLQYKPMNIHELLFNIAKQGKDAKYLRNANIHCTTI